MGQGEEDSGNGGESQLYLDMVEYGYRCIMVVITCKIPTILTSYLL